MLRTPPIGRRARVRPRPLPRQVRAVFREHDVGPRLKAEFEQACADAAATSHEATRSRARMAMGTFLQALVARQCVRDVTLHPRVHGTRQQQVRVACPPLAANLSCHRNTQAVTPRPMRSRTCRRRFARTCRCLTSRAPLCTARRAWPAGRRALSITPTSASCSPFVAASSARRLLAAPA